jgi:hypothetical protein
LNSQRLRDAPIGAEMDQSARLRVQSS